MPALPNPFESVAPSPHASDTAAVSLDAEMREAAAEPFESRFVLDEAAFMEAIEPPPLFLQPPNAVLKILAWRQA